MNQSKVAHSQGEGKPESEGTRGRVGDGGVGGEESEKKKDEEIAN